MKKLFFITGLLLLFACQESKKQSNLKIDANPFLQDWDTPYGIPPFLQIKDEHYMPAFEKGMEENLKEIDKIINNSEAPTFANTIEELERNIKNFRPWYRTIVKKIIKYYK